jgi:hypothetical protein
VTNHVLYEVTGTTSLVASCSCGWRSIGASSRARAEQRWRIHAVERRAADVPDHAKQVHDVTVARQAVLVEQRAATRARLHQFQVQRARSRDSFARLRDASERV